MIHDWNQRVVLTVLFALWADQSAVAQTEPEPDVQWAYASFFGTGWYRIDDQRNAFIVRGTPRWQFGEAGFDESGQRQIGYTLRLPLTLGLKRSDFTDLPGTIDPDNFATVGINLGFDADIPVSRHLSLRPNAELGYGTVINDSEYAWIYRGEIRSRYEFQPNDPGWTAHAALGYAGHTPNHGRSDSFSYVTLAVERSHKTRWQTSEGERIQLHWQLGYTDFIDELDFNSNSTGQYSTGHTWQIAVSLAKTDQPFRFWRLKFDRLGLGYHFSPSSEHQAITLVFRSIYDL